MASRPLPPPPPAPPGEPVAVSPTEAAARYQSQFDRLVVLVTGWLGDRDAAEDVAQAALIAAWEASRRGVPIARLDAWLTRAARNLAVSELRRRATRCRLLAVADPRDLPGAGSNGLAADPAVVVAWRDRLDEVLAALLTLPARSRDDLLLSLRAGGPAEAAAVRGLTPGAWQARLVRAREALRLVLAAPATDEPARRTPVAERRRLVADHHAQGGSPAAIARALHLPRHTVSADLAVLRRRSAAVVLLRQLLLFGDGPTPDGDGRPPTPPARRQRSSAVSGHRAPRPGRRPPRRPDGQLTLPLATSEAGSTAPAYH